MDQGAPLGDQGQGLQAPVAAVRQGPVTQTGPQTLGQVVVTETPGVREAPGGLVQVLAPALYVGADPGHQGGQDQAEGQGGHHQGSGAAEAIKLGSQSQADVSFPWSCHYMSLHGSLSALSK